MIKFSALSIVSLLGIIIMSISCNNSTNPPPVPTKPLQLLQPIGGENFKVGLPVSVQWKINDLPQITSVGIKLSKDNGITFPIDLSVTSVPSSTMQITWTPSTNQVSTKCVIKIFDFKKDSIFDKSETFSVVANPLQLLFPIGGENFKVGQLVRVKWRINDSTQISSVQVDLSTDGKTFPFNIGNGSIPTNLTDTTWTPTAGQISTQCLIRIKGYGTSIYDKSGTFTVSN